VAYLDGQMLDMLARLNAKEATELTTIEIPEMASLTAIAASMVQSVNLLQEVSNLLTETMQEIKMLRLGMSMAVEEDLTTLLEMSGDNVAVPFD